MDGPTQPLVAVIGHPIAGNPSQFAIEKALQAMELDWRVLSFDVTQQNLSSALSGLEVLGFRGIFFDQNLRPLSADLPEFANLAGSSGNADEENGRVLDCLYRESKSGFHGFDAEASWIRRLLSERFENVDEHSKKKVCIAGKSRHDLEALMPADVELVNVQSIKEASVVLLAEAPTRRPTIELEDWTGQDHSTLVIDMSNHHSLSSDLEATGFQVITKLRRQIAILSLCLEKWTGQEASLDVLNDAIEEYLAV